MLVVRDLDIGDVAADFRGDQKAPRGNEGVVGGFIVARLEPPDQAADQRGDQHDRRGGREHPMLAKALAQRWRPVRRSGLFRGLVLGLVLGVRRIRWSFHLLRLLRGRPALPGLSIHGEHLDRDYGATGGSANFARPEPNRSAEPWFRRAGAPLSFVNALRKKKRGTNGAALMRIAAIYARRSMRLCLLPLLEVGLCLA